VEHYGLIAVEDLNIQGLSRGILAGPVYDAGWHSFFGKLSYWPARAGREMVTWNQPSVRMRSGRAQDAGVALACMSGMRVVGDSKRGLRASHTPTRPGRAFAAE
jgi:hypothetical protein